MVVAMASVQPERQARPAVRSMSRKQDDFDMAKMQKSLQREQRKSLMSRSQAAKLTPAEIRSLNHGSEPPSRPGSIRSIASQASNHHHHHQHRSPNTPSTSDNLLLQQAVVQNRGNSALPAPLVSASVDRRGSTASNRSIYVPRALDQVQATHVQNNGSVSPSASLYRGVATYRGPELARAGSLTMLQHPSQQIVSNPLSAFSRPRQSTLASSPDKSRPPTQLSQYQTAGSSFVTTRTSSIGMTSQTSSRQQSPVRRTDSLVSIEDGPGPAVSENKKTTDQLALPQSRASESVETTKPDDQLPSDSSTKQKPGWRRTLTGPSEPNDDVVHLRKEYRRRTLMLPANQKYCLHAIHYDDTKPGVPPSLKDSLKDDLPSAKTAFFKDQTRVVRPSGDFDQHPAVRPLTSDSDAEDDLDESPSMDKGKEREVEGLSTSDTESSPNDSIPTYARCSCCGKIRPPAGAGTDLSTVMENENLRSNFNMEAGREIPVNRRRASSINSSHRKYTPIIPLRMGSETKQARIEPLSASRPASTTPASRPAPVVPPSTRQTSTKVAPTSQPESQLVGVAVNKAGDVIASHSTPLAIMPRMKVDLGLTRFGSLNMKKEERDDLERKTAAAAESSPPPIPPMSMRRFDSLYGRNGQLTQLTQPVRQSPLNPGTNKPQSAYQAQQARAQQQNDQTSQQMLHRNAVKQPSIYSNDEEIDDGLAVDLSSFDGSFVQNNISGSANHTRSYSQSHQRTSSNSTSEYSNQYMSYITQDGHSEPTVVLDGDNELSSSGPSSPVSARNSMDVQRQLPLSSGLLRGIYKTTSPPTSPAIPGESAKVGEPDMESAHTDQVSDQDRVETAPVATKSVSEPVHMAVTALADDQSQNTQSSLLPDATDTDTANVTPKSTTVVRIIQSPSLSVSSPTSPAPSQKGPMRLGDWVLPESPARSRRTSVSERERERRSIDTRGE